MKIYTSFFSNYRNFPKEAKVIQIARTPVQYGGEHWVELAPSEKLLRDFKNGVIGEAEYKDRYIEELKNKFGTPEKCLKWIEARGNGKDLVLCCYEKKGKFCHRNILREWLGVGEEI